MLLLSACLKELLAACHEILYKALYEHNEVRIEQEMDFLTADLIPVATVEDKSGDADILKKFIECLTTVIASKPV